LSAAAFNFMRELEREREYEHDVHVFDSETDNVLGLLVLDLGLHVINMFDTYHAVEEVNLLSLSLAY
ncbi:unnamed protein product, partial [Didymodactylos carnosus]